MARRSYTAGLRRLANEGIADTVSSGDIRATLVESGYTFSAAHATMETANVPSSARIATSGALTLSAADGTLPIVRQVTHSPATITSVPASRTPVGVLYFYEGATDALRVPLAFVDGADFTATPSTTSGNNVTLTATSGYFVGVEQAT